MRYQNQQNTNTISGIFVLLLGGLITAVLLLLNYLNILHLSFEIVFAPFIVIALLTFGDKFLIYLLLHPMSFVSKLISKDAESSQPQKNN